MNTSQQGFTYLAERFADIQLLRYRLKGFNELDITQKRLIYYLAQATLCGRDITFDQFGAANIKIRKVLEAIVLHYQGNREQQDFKALELYLKCVWFASGIHHHYNQTKFQPHFSEQFFRHAFFNLPDVLLNFTQQSREELYQEISPLIFNPDIAKKRVCLDSDIDKLQASAVNYYEGVTSQEAENYYALLRKQAPVPDEMPSYGLNTTLVKQHGELVEITWRVGERYSRQIQHIIFWLQKALTTCENTSQEEVIRLLIEYYTTGDLSTFDRYSIAWTAENNSQVDFINGFIEVYSDLLGIKGSWEGIVHYKDLDASQRTQKICTAAQWFEDNSPIDPQFRKPHVQGVTANVVIAAMLGGDEYPASAIGINLPNADWIRSRYGSKSVTIGNLTEAYNQAARNSGMREEFICDDNILRLISQYGDTCDELHTDLHECLGHGSGQLLHGVTTNMLRSYASTIEEARADLFALYYIADKKIIELQLLPSEEAFKAQYYSYLLNGLLTQMVRIPLGAQLEEAHMRNRALISRYVLQHSNGTISLFKHANKTYLAISDYAHLRQLFADLLREIQRIKSEGDYLAAKHLVETYAITLPHDLHSEVLQRYAQLNIAPYKGFINPHLCPVYSPDGNIIDVTIDYSETYTQQMLRYGREY